MFNYRKFLKDYLIFSVNQTSMSSSSNCQPSKVEWSYLVGLGGVGGGQQISISYMVELFLIPASAPRLV